MSFLNGPGWGGQSGTPVGNQPGYNAQPAPQVSVQTQGQFLTHSFVWMFAGLLLSAAVAFLVEGSPAVQGFATGAFFPILIFQLVVVLAISWGINRVNATVALGMFFVYAASLGLTLGLIITAYAQESGGQASVVEAFVTAAGMFGGAALYGATTKRSLAGMGGILTMGLIGLIVAMVVNLFIGSSTIDFILSIGGVLLFTALTAWDVQRISVGQLVTMTGSVEKAAVLGALRLYLDFINLFLFLLRLFGGGRR